MYINPHTSQRYTFLDVKNTAIGFGSALRTQWNWQKDDVLSIYSPNCIDTPALTWGTLWAHGVVSPANPAYSVSELSFQLKDSGAKAVLTQAPFLKTVLKAAENANIPRSRILLLGEGSGVEDVRHFKDLIRGAGDEVIRERSMRSPTDLAYIVYSSGTTGLPKGVMLTQKNIVAQILMVTVVQSELSCKGGPKGSGDTVLAVLPFYHIYGGFAVILVLKVFTFTWMFPAKRVRKTCLMQGVEQV